MMDECENRDILNSRETDSLLAINGNATGRKNSDKHFYGTNQDECDGTNDQIIDTKNEKPGRVYRTRFWILAISCAMGFIRDVIWITWGPISESMKAFPGWDASTVALLTNWGTIMFVLSVLPTCWAIQRWGLRVGTVASAALMAAGTAVRCITPSTPTFTVLCNVGAILAGIGGTFVIMSPPLIATVWFPAHERTTAMAIMMGTNQMGSMASFLVPLMVQIPSETVPAHVVRQQVMFILYIVAGVCGVLLAAVVVYFPAKPPSPPSLSSTLQRFPITPGIKALATNKRFLLLTLSYGVFVGTPIGWLTVLNYSLLPLGFHENDTMWVGLGSVVASGFLPVLLGRLNDLAQGYIKLLILIHMFLTTAFLYWFLLLTFNTIPVSTWQVYVTVICVMSLSYASMPLFFEAAIDIAYPVPEILVSGVMIAADSLVITVFLLIMNIPNAGVEWMVYTQIATSSLTAIPLLCCQLDNTRANIDNTDNTIDNINNTGANIDNTRA